MKKKISTILASIGLSLAMATSVFAAGTLTDIGDSYAKTEIQTLYNEGIIAGYPDNTFKPKNNITREEFAKMLSVALGLPKNESASKKFTDVSDWARPYVGALVKAEITTGTGATTFGAKDPLTREQMATFFVRAMGWEDTAKDLYNEGVISCDFADQGKVDDYAKANVALAKSIGFINGIGDNKFDPDNKAQRQAVALLVYKYVMDFDDVYLPKLLVVEHPDLTSVTYNANAGTYTFTFKANGNFSNNQVVFDEMEVYAGLNYFYYMYRDFINENYTAGEWAAIDPEGQVWDAASTIMTWNLTYSGLTFSPAYQITEDTTAEELADFFLDLMAGIDNYLADHPGAVLDEETVLEIGYDCGILARN